jgi:hypothetical protein
VREIMANSRNTNYVSRKKAWVNYCKICGAHQVLTIQTPRSKKGYKCNKCRGNNSTMKRRVNAINSLIGKKPPATASIPVKIKYDKKLSDMVKVLRQQIHDTLMKGYSGYSILPQEVLKYLFEVGELPEDYYDLLEKAEDLL